MRLWRIYRRIHGSGLDGTGGLFAGGRWSKHGHRVVYFSDTPSLAVLEKLVHLDPDFLEDHLLGLFELDQESRRVEELGSFPSNWIENLTGTAECGTGWLARNIEVLLSVPSVVVPEQRNFLLNPTHPEASRLRQVHERPFRFDTRLM